MSIIFGPLNTLPKSSKSCDCVTFGVLRYLFSTFLLKADMKSYKSLETAAIFYSSEPFLKQGTVYVEIFAVY